MSKEIGRPPFDTAPAFYAFNVPRYYTLIQRAREFAYVIRRKMHWCFATDLPLNAEDRELAPQQVDHKSHLEGAVAFSKNIAPVAFHWHLNVDATSRFSLPQKGDVLQSSRSRSRLGATFHMDDSR